MSHLIWQLIVFTWQLEQFVLRNYFLITVIKKEHTDLHKIHIQLT